MATDPLAKIRSDLKSKSKPAASSQKNAPTSQYTNLLLAIAHANGHAQPTMWAKQVTDYLATLK